ncbi:MAG: tryptophan synthase subunit alpha [bacterium]|nr:tryptophan synthase subunit alpha [bacterium]
MNKQHTETEERTEQKVKNKISLAFASGKKAFIPFLTAGDPDAASTVSFILEMEKAGANLIEIGIPFSDPTAEGVVIQDANLRALKGGMTTDGVFEIVRQVREQSQVPLVFMTYLNPVFHYGYDAFFSKCEELGVDGIIIPDLPYEEKEEVELPAAAHNVSLISMIAPTSENRIQKIAREAEGFLYLVSSMGVTGIRSEIQTDLESIVKSIRKVTTLPCAVGFGISTPEQAAKMAAISDGSIVGSAIVKQIAEQGRAAAPQLSAYVKAMRQALDSL